jgi:GNAT superfamily N-acetyltransferase
MTDIRPMQQSDVDAAERVFRLAFGTRFRLPDPMTFRGDGAMIGPRFAANPATALVAVDNGRIVGGTVGMDWGSVLIIGPVFVDPAASGRGIARALVARMIELPVAQRKSFIGLFTFPESATHLRLYESLGFVPQLLTPVMSKDVRPAQSGGVLYSSLSANQQDDALDRCKTVTAALLPGLDLSREIRGLGSLRLGETVLLDGGGAGAGADGFAVCHIGAGSEASSGTMLVKFAAVQRKARDDFARLLGHCEALAARAGATRISAGVNVGRSEAYRLMQDLGYRAGLVGVAMLRPAGPGYNRPDVFAIDDWR